MVRKDADMPAEGILNWVLQCKFGGHAQHTAAPYAFVDGTGAFPHSGLRARIRDGGLRLTTGAGGPTTTGTQKLSSNCPRGPVELVGLCCVCMP